MATAIAPAPSSTSMTLEQYLHTSYSPDVDFLDGQIQERNLGENEHAALQWFIPLALASQQQKLRFKGRAEMRIRVSPDRVRICDLCILHADAPYEKVATTPPMICIEIMSPEDRISRAIKVLEDHRAMGVLNIWLIDPYERLAYSFNSDGLHQQENLLLRSSKQEIELDVNALFLQLDQEENKEKA